MLMANFLGKEGAAIVAAHFLQPSRVIQIAYSFSVLPSEPLRSYSIFLMNFRHPVVATRFDGKNTSVESCQCYVMRIRGTAVDELLPG